MRIIMAKITIKNMKKNKFKKKAERIKNKNTDLY